MSEWAWVALGFGVTYGAMSGYAVWLQHRLSGVNRRIEKIR
ncbi:MULTISPECIES: hypothetical protein [unclassified Blastococcus]|nr:MULTISPECIES: hypothetical protein [unclassified Blastococcus]